MLDNVEFAITEIDGLTLDRQLAAAVCEPSPLPRLDHDALETERPYILGADRAAVIKPKRPFTLGPHGAERIAERDCDDPWDFDQPLRKLTHPKHSSARKLSRPPRPSTAGPEWGQRSDATIIAG